MKQLIAALLIAWMAAAESASVTFYTGNELMDLCKGTAPGDSNTNIDRYNQCVIYLAGVIDSEDFVSGVNDTKHIVCMPERTSVIQLQRVFVKYMEASPEIWHETAAGHALVAFRRAWPCP